MLFPTLNLAPEQELLPKVGVYATETRLDGKLYRSAPNVGFRPTFDGTLLGVESHLFDFSREVTKGRLEVRFLGTPCATKKNSAAPPTFMPDCRRSPRSRATTSAAATSAAVQPIRS